MSNTTAPRPLIDELRDFARSNIVPINSVIGLSAVLVCVLDFCAPLIGATGLQLIAAAVAAIALWLLWSAKKRLPGAEAVWRLVVGVLLIFFAIGTAAASTKAHVGGFLASSSEKGRAIQIILFDMQADVAQIKDGVAKANAKLDVLATAGSDCSDFDCAFFDGAPASKFEEIASRGVAIPTYSQLLMRPMLNRTPNRFEVMEVLLKRGPSINEPFITNVALMDEAYQGVEKALKNYMPKAEISKLREEIASCELWKTKFRWLELAILTNDTEMVEWLIERGADPKLRNKWCDKFPNTFSASQLMTKS